jgi:hypothetical protein
LSEANKEAQVVRLEDLKKFGHTFKLKTVMPEDLDFLKSGQEKELKGDGKCEKSNISAAREQNHITFGRNCHGPNRACDIGTCDMSVAESLKKFGAAFKLKTPMPDDLERIFSRRYEKKSSVLDTLAILLPLPDDEPGDFDDGSAENTAHRSCSQSMIAHYGSDDGDNVTHSERDIASVNAELAQGSTLENGEETEVVSNDDKAFL